MGPCRFPDGEVPLADPRNAGGHRVGFVHTDVIKSAVWTNQFFQPAVLLVFDSAESKTRRTAGWKNWFVQTADLITSVCTNPTRWPPAFLGSARGTSPSGNRQGPIRKNDYGFASGARTDTSWSLLTKDRETIRFTRR